MSHASSYGAIRIQFYNIEFSPNYHYFFGGQPANHPNYHTIKPPNITQVLPMWLKCNIRNQYPSLEMKKGRVEFVVPVNGVGTC